MIMVTDQMDFAREISDRVCFFNERKIFEQAPLNNYLAIHKMKELNNFYMQFLTQDKKFLDFICFCIF